METLNKNWLLIIIIIIVFFGLGFLFGWVLKPGNNGETEHNSHHDCMSMDAPFKMMHFMSEIEEDSTKDIDIDVGVILDKLEDVISDSYDTTKSVVKIIKI